MTSSIYIVDIISEVVEKITAVKNYTYGRPCHILNKLQKLNNSTTQQGDKYPMVGLFTPIEESMGNNGYYSDMTIPRIIIAALSNLTDDPVARMDKTFRPILYPIYEQFLVELAKHKNTVVNDPGAIQHTKIDSFGDQPQRTGTNDYIDAIEIRNLKITIFQNSTCG